MARNGIGRNGLVQARPACIIAVTQPPPPLIVDSGLGRATRSPFLRGEATRTDHSVQSPSVCLSVKSFDRLAMRIFYYINMQDPKKSLLEDIFT